MISFTILIVKDVVVESCAQNIEFLKELLSSWKEENSFISKKKSRETRSKFFLHGGREHWTVN